jgi:hypothetical protein
MSKVKESTNARYVRRKQITQSSNAECGSVFVIRKAEHETGIPQATPAVTAEYSVSIQIEAACDTGKNRSVVEPPS